MISDKIGIPEALGYSVLGIGVVFLMLIILMVIIGIMGKAMASKKAAAAAPAVPAAPAPQAVSKEKAPGTAGDIDLYNVEPKTAAMIMAIVADELGAPINELRFVSIKAID